MRNITTFISRRAAIVTAIAASAVLAVGCAKDTTAAAEGDMSMGTGPVTVVEYASVTCHVCAAWQHENWEAFKTRYIDTNKVRFVFREIPTPPANVAVAGFQVARCAGEDKYFDVVHAIMESQTEWQTGGNPRDTLFRIGNGAGLTNSQIETCIKDPKGLEAIDARARAAREAGVDGTPSFFVNGTKIVSPGSASGPTLNDIAAAIDAELAK
ncbi:thioredoxin domain-containing protein [Brevundimonas sp. M20]|uniref:thioredoxin domain-containing protein n=1 Tax=Brevundimonas sp. M20 TaxID=2591463 RepID=UPI00114749C9|nr:thioredoxin domain-containing protein [Brevundimonas sp. M20]QDH74116.1 DsbA family protein [Brevundimonas sp. M20]